jgi:multisubunit Na+/H+ antiporter MnhB subunit
MGWQVGRKSALRHVKLILLIAIILALSLAPAVLLRFTPRATLGYVLKPIRSIIESGTGFSAQFIDAIGLLTMFVLAILSATALLLLLVRELTRSVREGQWRG